MLIDLSDKVFKFCGQPKSKRRENVVSVSDGNNSLCFWGVKTGTLVEGKVEITEYCSYSLSFQVSLFSTNEWIGLKELRSAAKMLYVSATVLWVDKSMDTLLSPINSCCLIFGLTLSPESCVNYIHTHFKSPTIPTLDALLLCIIETSYLNI